MIRLDRALLLPLLAALGCAGAPPSPRAAAPAAAPRPIVAAATISAAPIVAAATIAPSPAPIDRAALPAGWVRGALAPLDPGPKTAPLNLGPQRTIVAPIALRLADLPLIEITPRPLDTQRPGPKAPPPGEPSREIFIAPGCSRASVRNHDVGTITVGWSSLPIAPQSGGGVMLGGFNGGDGHDRYTPASWRTLDRAPGGALRYRETNAWFDVITCKAYEVRHMEAVATPIASGLGYAFRTHCPSCKAADVDQLHLITPGTGWGTDPFDHTEIALGPGQSTTRVLTLGSSAIRRFREAGSLADRVADAQLGLDIVQGTGESEPTAMVYVTDPPPSRF